MPKIESLYIRARAARTYICGPLSIADMHSRGLCESVKEYKEQNKHIETMTWSTTFF